MLAITLWSASGLRVALDRARPALERIRPDAAQLHGAPSLLRTQGPEVAAAVRALVPGVEIWLGVAGDAGRTAVAQGRLSVAALHRRRVGVAQTARDCGASAVVLNCEGAWRASGAPVRWVDASGARVERRPEGYSAVDAGRWVRDLRAALDASVRLEHTAYLSRISDYPWAAWLGPGLCTRTWPQAYWAAGGTARWARGVWRRAWEARPIPGGVDVAPYLQAHGCATADLTWWADQWPHVAFWAAGDRMDAAGELAARALAEVGRRGHTGVGRVAAYQRAAGLVADGRAGPRTLASLGLA